MLARSGAFDAEYYLKENPDIAALNIDPLLHYVEEGAQQGRIPSPDFDVAYYLEQCARRGERPPNPLLHFITVGAREGLKSCPSGAGIPIAAPATPVESVTPATNVADDLILGIDAVSVDRMSDDSLRLTMRGWAIAEGPIHRITLQLGDTVLGYAAYGLGRPDVAAVYPDHAKADHAGYSVTVEALPEGTADVLELLLAVEIAGGKRCVRPFSFDMRSGEIRLARSARERLAPAATRPHAAPSPLRLAVDEIEVNSRGILETSGWAVCFLNVAAVRILAGDTLLGLAEYGHAREDVAGACPEYPRSRQSGFHYKGPVGHLGAGLHFVTIQALAQTGVTREATFPVVVPDVPAVPVDPQFHFHCDVLSLSTRGSLAIEGWAVCTDATESIAVSVGETQVGQAQLGLPRPDVGNIFNQYPHARHAGFSFRHSLDLPVAAGEHVVTLRIKDKGGIVRDMPLPIQAVESSEPAAGAAGAAAGADPDLAIAMDLPKIVNGAAEGAVTGSLSIAGWTLARAGVKGINIAVNGNHVSKAHYGVRREDVASAFPGRSDALMSGFAALIPNWVLPKGPQTMTITVADALDRTESVSFGILVEEVPEGEGPWSLRRKIPQSEVDLQMRILQGLSCRPVFRLAIRMQDGAEALNRMRATLASLRQQIYPDWHATIVPESRKGVSRSLRRAVLEGFEGLADRIDFFGGKRSVGLAAAAARCASGARGARGARGVRGAKGRGALLLCTVSAGDVLGCDALLELALATGMARQADFFYSDERRTSPVTKSVDAFFKPAWSPDLLLSTNYIGRLWAARAELVERAALSVRDWLERGDYEAVLRLTEAASSIEHVPKVLSERGSARPEAAPLERAALRRALKRRGERACVRAGCAAGIYQVRRKRRTQGLVSIIIPTCAARGYIKTCLNSLKKKTAYRNFEIICIENIPAEKKSWKRWLRKHADIVIETFEPFNWSRYNNLCAERASGEFLLFLNDDVEVLESTWLDVLLRQAERPAVGAVGPQLLYGDRSVQHAGLALTAMGQARHVFRHAQPTDPGYFGLALTERNVIAVTGACLLTRRQVFDAVGRFDEAHTVVNNDLDYCLKTWRAGYLNVYTPHAQLVHHELASRSEMSDDYDSSAFVGEWRDVFVRGDPYLNPNLSRDFDDLSPEHEPLRVVSSGHPLMAREAVHQILVLKLDHIGDCMTALPALRRLKQLFPKARLTVLANRATRSVWAAERAVSEIIDFDFFHARSGLGAKEIEESQLVELRQRLEPSQFDLAVDLRKAMDTRPILQCSGAKHLAGFDYQGKYPWLDVAVEWEGDTRYAPKRQHVADDLLSLVEAIGTSCRRDRSVLRPPPRTRLSLTAAERREIFRRPVICIHPASGTEMRQWPPEHFAELIDLMAASHDVHAVVIGGPDEMDIAQKVLDAVRTRERVFCLVGKLKLAELPRLISRCALFVGNNSGPKHMAGALGVPTIGVHSGVIDSLEWGPLGDNAVAIRRDMSCSPCYIDKRSDCPRNLACIRGLGPIGVYKTAARMLAIRARRIASVKRHDASNA